MNRLTAIGLASLVAYGLLIASKYTGVVSAAREPQASKAASLETQRPRVSGVQAMSPEPRASTLAMPAPAPRAQPVKGSAIAVEFRTTRDLKAFADALEARRAHLTADERYHLARTLEECQFAMSINEDLAAYSAKQRAQFLSSLPAGEPNNAKRIAAYDAVDNTQRCAGFQNAKISPRDIDELYRRAALQGDPRAQARLLTAELTKNNSSSGDRKPGEAAQQARMPGDTVSQMIGLLESGDPEAILMVGEYLARSAQQNGLRVGPNGETPEPSAFLGGFTLAACDMGQECGPAHRDAQSACAFGGYCDPSGFEELYQNFIASPWAYSQATRYRTLVHTAIDTRNYGLIGLSPQSPAFNRPAPQ